MGIPRMMKRLRCNFGQLTCYVYKSQDNWQYGKPSLSGNLVSDSVEDLKRSLLPKLKGNRVVAVVRKDSVKILELVNAGSEVTVIESLMLDGAYVDEAKKLKDIVGTIFEAKKTEGENGYTPGNLIKVS